MSHIAWPDIEGFHNVRKTVEKFPELLRDVNSHRSEAGTVRYRAKVKLHGTNAAVQVRPNGKVFAQSRTQIISPGSDNAGFAAWVVKHEDQWATVLDAFKLISRRPESVDGVIVFGEWCGPGVMKGVAINKVPDKIFAVFAVAAIPTADENDWLVDPERIADVAELISIPRVHVLPWYGEAIDIPISGGAEVLQPILDGINERVATVEACDPWVKSEFGVEGTGEGLVFYPQDDMTMKTYKNFLFKAKGEKHKIVAKSAPVQIEASVAASIEAFVAMMLTSARLEQGARAAGTDGNGEPVFEKRLIGPFMAWVAKDVEKESKAELEASSLTWKQVAKTVTDSARRWYIEKAEAL